MSKGREVADAYIDVHGDVSKFRRSLDKAAVSGRKAGREAADSFSKGWEERTKSGFLKKWDGTLDAMYSNKAVDWKRLVGTFDATGFEDAGKKIDKFMKEQQAQGKITEQQYERISKAARNQMKVLAAEEEAHREAASRSEKDRKKRLSDEQALQWELAKTYRQQERYNKSFEGLFRNRQLKDIAADFDKIATAMARSDWDSWTKHEQDLSKVRDRVREVTDHYYSMGQMSRESGDKIRRSVDEHITAEQRRRRALKESETAIRDADEATKRWNRTMSGMMFNAELRDLEDSFKRISKAMATEDWSGVARGKRDMKDFQRSVEDTAQQMRNMGRINNEEHDRLNRTLRRVVRNSAEFNVNLGGAGRMMRTINGLQDSMRKGWQRMDSDVKLILYAILAAAGPIATTLSGISASLVAVISSVGMAVSAIVPLAAGAAAFATGIFLAVSAFDEIKARLPGIQQSLDSIAETWKQQAKNFGDAWGDSLDSLLSSFAAKFEQFDIGTPLGKAFAGITKAFEDVVNGPAFTAFMKAMETDLPDAAQGLGAGFAGLFSGLLSLMAGAAPVAKLLGEDFARWGTNIAASLEKARESGEMNKVFEKARESLLAVFDLTGSVGSALGTMFMIGADTGNSLLGSLTKVVDKFNEWMKTDEGRAKMLEWFENGERIIKSFEPLAVGLGKALDSLVTPHSIASLENLMKGFGELLPTLGELLSAISDLNILNILVDLLNLVGDVIKPLLPAFSELATIVGGAVQDAIEALSPHMAAVGEALVPVMELLAKLVADVLPPLIPLIVLVIEAAAKLIPALGEMLEFAAGVVSIVGDVVKAILEMDGLKTIIEGFGTAMMGALDLILGLLTGDWDRAWEGAKGIVTGFGDVFVGVWELIVQVADWIKEVWNGFKMATEEVFGGLGEFFSGVWAGITGGFEEFGNGFKGFFSDTWENIKTGASEAWDNISTTATDAWGSLTETVGGFLSGIKGNVDEKLDGFWTKFDEVFPGTRALAEEEWGKLQTQVGEIVGSMQSRVAEKWDAMSAKVTEKAAEIYTNANAKWEEVQSRTSEVYEAVRAKVAEKWDEMSSKVADVAGVIGGAVKTKWDEIKKNTSDKWTDVTKTVSDKWNSMTDKTRTATQELGRRAGEGGNWVRDRISGPLNDLKGRWDSGWNQIGNILSRAWSTMKQAALTGLNSLMQEVIRLPGRILNGLIALPGQLYTAGRNMIQGMINGVVDMASNMVTAAVNAASNAVQAVKNFLGIKSPSRVFMGIGEYMGEGMVIGIERTAGAVADAAQTLADAAVGEFAVDRMYSTGQAAAKGLADGLRSNKSVLQGVINDITPNVGAMAVNPALRPPTPLAEAVDNTGKRNDSLLVEKGAIQINSNVTDPKLAAEMVLDGLISATNL